MLALTKKKVEKLVQLLGQKDGLKNAETVEKVFESLITISNPLEFEGKVREQAMKRLMDLFHMSIWYDMGRPGISDFGGRYSQELNQWKELEQANDNSAQPEK